MVSKERCSKVYLSNLDSSSGSPGFDFNQSVINRTTMIDKNERIKASGYLYFD